MTYHTSSDVPVPYGRVVRTEQHHPHQPRDYHGEKTHGVAILASNCGGRSGRYHYLDSLKKHLQVNSFSFPDNNKYLCYRLMCGEGVGGGTTCHSSVQVRLHYFFLLFVLTNDCRSLHNRLPWNRKVQVLSCF